MNNDRLRDFIDKNRNEFDEVESPQLDHIWDDISTATQQDRPSHFKWIALVAFMMILLTAMWYNSYQTNQKLNRLEHFVMNSPIYQSEHQKLMKMVADKERLIEASDIKESEYIELFNELKELENNSEAFEKDFELYGDSSELMRTLFKNYERKAKILELLLFENEKKSQNENNNRHEM